MSKHEKVLLKVTSGRSDADVKFIDLTSLLNYLGFEERVRSSHHIFYKQGINEILNLQPKGNKAKAYQVKQVRNIIIKYKLSILDA
ncbi:type II toxin-antitoxin system HicA family toxin [candidate division KSB1 bacterium]|nr:type II toxin-antitoxin system HicA family toxin [candidate division KSB1 bacterium]